MKPSPQPSHWKENPGQRCEVPVLALEIPPTQAPHPFIGNVLFLAMFWRLSRVNVMANLVKQGTSNHHLAQWWHAQNPTWTVPKHLVDEERSVSTILRHRPVAFSEQPR